MSESIKTTEKQLDFEFRTKIKELGEFYKKPDIAEECARRELEAEHDFNNWRPEPPRETLTCYRCGVRKDCGYVDDPYNTDGDCLAGK